MSDILHTRIACRDHRQFAFEAPEWLEPTVLPCPYPSCERGVAGDSFRISVTRTMASDKSLATDVTLARDHNPVYNTWSWRIIATRDWDPNEVDREMRAKTMGVFKRGLEANEAGVDFSLLTRLHLACVKGDLSWHVEFCEVNRSWEFDISGPATSECFHIKKTGDFADGVARCMERLRLLGLA